MHYDQFTMLDARCTMYNQLVTEFNGNGEDGYGWEI